MCTHKHLLKNTNISSRDRSHTYPCSNIHHISKDTQHANRSHTTHTLTHAFKDTLRYTNVKREKKQENKLPTYACTHIAKDTKHTHYPDTLYKEITHIHTGYTHIFTKAHSTETNISNITYWSTQRYIHTQHRNRQINPSSHKNLLINTCTPTYPKTQSTNDAQFQRTGTHTQRPKYLKIPSVE